MSIRLDAREENGFTEFEITGSLPLVNDMIRSLNHYEIETFRYFRGEFSPFPFHPFQEEAVAVAMDLSVRSVDADHVRAWSSITGISLRS